MKERCSIRSQSSDDFEFLHKLYQSTIERELSLLPFSEEQKIKFVEMQFNAQNRSCLENFADGEFFIIEYENKPIGRIYRAMADGILHIIDISILPEWRNLGIGSSLIVQSQDLAESRNVPLRLSVEKLNPAQHLYARLGFELIQEQAVFNVLEWRKDVFS